jgi:hypothetical protein
VCPGLAHRIVRCATGQCPVHQGESAQTPQLRVFQTQLRYNSPDCPVCHRTVRCTSGATATCAQRSTLQSEQCNSDVRADGQRGTVLSSVAPDCPVPHEDKASNGRPAPSPNGRMTWRHTGLSGGAPDCPMRPSPAAFSNGYNLVGGYKYHPNWPLQGGSPSNIPSHLVDIIKPSQPYIFIDPSYAQDLGHYNNTSATKRELAKESLSCESSKSAL